MGKKIKGRELLKACYVKVFAFDSESDFLKYVEELNYKRGEYKIAFYNSNVNGKVIASFNIQYNDVPLYVE